VAAPVIVVSTDVGVSVVVGDVWSTSLVVLVVVRHDEKWLTNGMIDRS